LDQDLRIWKELAIEKQMLMRTATDALGLDPECSDEELREGLAKGIKQIADAESTIKKARMEHASASATLQIKLADTQKALAQAEARIAELTAEKEASETSLTAARDSSQAETKVLKDQLDAKNKELKSINVALADTPANVVKKIKALNKKKHDETVARKKIEDELRNIKKDKRELQLKLDVETEKATALTEDYKALRDISEVHYTQLKESADDETDLTALPDMREELTKAVEEISKDVEEAA
jgi:colicin import membrane protein